MKYILTPDLMREADKTAIEKYNIPGIVLMENAARSAAEYIDDILSLMNKPSVLIFCGSGNNGGDGFAIARHLHEKYYVKVAWIGDDTKMSDETKTNFIAIDKLGIETLFLGSEDDVEKMYCSSDCIIDSMIGVGGSENLRGLIVPILKKINGINAVKIAIDAPTGLNTETGIAHPDCFRADYTITMFAKKTGMLLNDGIGKCGRIYKAYLGAPEHIVRTLSNVRALENMDISMILPKRKKISSKFDYGKIVIIAGSNKYPGAAALCSNAAISSGAGLVHLFSPLIHPAIFPDVIPMKLTEGNGSYVSKKDRKTIEPTLKKANVVTIGPGIGDEKETIDFVKSIIKDLDDSQSLIIDADGLKAINKKSKLRKNIILTPHAGEFSRITDIPREEIEKNAAHLAMEWAEKLNCTLLLKHVPTIITDGKNSYWNIIGNPGMAVGGSGDVLTGIISGIMALGVEPLEATALAAYIHASAGDNYVKNYSQETLTASSLISQLKEVFPGAVR